MYPCGILRTVLTYPPLAPEVRYAPVIIKNEVHVILSGDTCISIVGAVVAGIVCCTLTASPWWYTHVDVVFIAMLCMSVNHVFSRSIFILLPITLPNGIFTSPGVVDKSPGVCDTKYMDPSVSHGYGISPEHTLITLSDTLYHALTIIGKNPSLCPKVASVLIATAPRNPVEETYGFDSCSFTDIARRSIFVAHPVTFKSVLVTPFAVE